MRSERDGRPLLVAYRALGLGDLLTGIPALRALARAHPGHRRVLCAPGALAPLAALSGAVDEVSATDPLAAPKADLHAADIAVNLHGGGPESHRVLQATRPRRLIAFGCPQAGHAGPPWRVKEHERERWCRLLGEAGIPADPLDLDLPVPRDFVPPAARGATVIHPGAASGARRWPAERWAQVARHERAEGRRVLLTGSAAERRLCERVASLAELPPESVTAGRTGVAQLAALVAAAGRVLCGDTGVAHLATAFSTPSVVLFGPTPPGLWGPPAGRRRHIALWAGGTGDPHADEPDAGLLALEVADVVAASERLAGAAAAA